MPRVSATPRGDLSVVPVGRLTPADDEVETAEFVDGGGQHLHREECVNGVAEGVVLQQDEFVGAHG